MTETKNELTVGERFVGEIQRQFTAELGDTLKFTDYEKVLAQHMYAKVDAALKAAETKRLDSNGTIASFEWKNVNLQKLALDAVHRIGLGLDALIPNHIHPIAYWNKRLNQYDIDLRIGYMGKDYCRRKSATEEPVEVIYQLICETDIFKPVMKSGKVEVETYEFEITKPFDRGKVVGGFGYIAYQDQKKNRLILVSARDFQKAKSAAQSDAFWKSEKWEQEMMYKTIVHRVADKLPLDPKKVNAKSYAYVEQQEEDERAERDAAENANTTPIDISSKVHVDPELTSEETKSQTTRVTPLD